ncbi:hypothetical protein [Maribacter aurantiacus]|uniref:Uncharacterized protein n=1 Tax=Maribacter aurantiacus TaxID=1882343 RepID=A0A5R8MC95_9FLAO|nr:hypothetical protein [Maribacter aurantiacus]TLF47120.1 hypothetical protein FEK29_04970 [Maribacter aurantiacus]
MKHKYFGILKKEILPKDQRLEIEFLQNQNILKKNPSLLDNPIYERNEKMWFIDVNNNFDNPYYDIEESVLLEYYNFLLDVYNTKINKGLIYYTLETENELFGISREEQRKIELTHFKKIFETLPAGFMNIKVNTSTSGIQYSQKISRIELLFNMRETMRQVQRHYSKEIKEFLLGNSDYFNDDLAKDNEYIELTVDFESKLKILLSLNDKYNFEDDLFFSRNRQLYEKFKYYKGLSFDFEIYKFIHHTINNIEDNFYSHVSSLYYFLKGKRLIKENAGEFRDFVNREFDKELIRIKPENEDNKKHRYRLTNLEEEYTNFK